VTSRAVSEGQAIPPRLTCDGESVSPPMAFHDVPPRARELALVVEDLDADRFVHWTVLRVSPDTALMPEGRTPRGSIETEDGFGDRGWGGPCAPEGDDPHRCVFALYGLSRPLSPEADVSPDGLRAASGSRKRPSSRPGASASVSRSIWLIVGAPSTMRR
jgi:Raf kinase inhibitor-like YbhB/YbcL family protein